MEAHYDQFIGLYPNAVPVETCNKIINYFEQMTEIQRNYSRQNSEGASQLMKKDESISTARPTAYGGDDSNSILFCESDPTTQVVSEYLSNCFQHYISTYDILKNDHMMSLYHKVQKTSPGGGYHIWHCEQGAGAHMRRMLVYTLYLNTIVDGGETEFLYQQKRYPARKGDICIFPAHFTHPHRGNPPLKEDKYIMTGWMENVIIPVGTVLQPQPM